MFIVERTVDSGALGEEGAVGMWMEANLCSPPARLHSSFGLIWCLVCVTPATEAKADNPHHTTTQWIFPLRGGGVFNIGLGSPGAVECTTRQIRTKK